MTNPDHVPCFWMNETSGQLRPVVEAYVRGEPLDYRQVATMRVYLRQWMQGPWKGPMIDVLRTQLEQMTTREDLDRWFDRALAADIDPL